MGQAVEAGGGGRGSQAGEGRQWKQAVEVGGGGMWWERWLKQAVEGGGVRGWRTCVSISIRYVRYISTFE